MNLRDLDEQEIHAAQIRALQSRFHVEHQALVNWGAWSKDKRGIYPALTKNGVWDQFNRGACDPHGWGDEVSEEAGFAKQTDAAKSEPAEYEEYDEKSANALNDRISSSMCAEHIRQALGVAYCGKGGSWPGRWYQYIDSRTPQAFLERLEAGLMFVRRFV